MKKRFSLNKSRAWSRLRRLWPAVFLAMSGPAPAQDAEAWNDARVGMFVHWGLYSGNPEVWPTENMGGQATEWLQQWKNLTTAAYVSALKPQFAPSATWATDLAAAAKAAGVEYVVITTKHHDGFTLFNSTEYWSTGASDDASQTANPYGGSNISPAGRDLMQEFVAAVRAQGLKVGFYYSVVDWQHPNAYRGDNGLPKPAVMANGKYDESSPDPDPHTPSYKSYLYHHVEQLMTQYGTIDELWFDYSSSAVQGSDWGADALRAMIRTNQPNIMVNNRLYDGLENPNGDFGTPERTIPAAGLSFDWETCQSWDNTSWGYKALANGARYKTAREAAMLYAEASSKGGNMLLNVGPDRLGAIPPEQAALLAELGAWMAVNGEAIKQTRASGIDASGTWGRMTMNKSGTNYYAIVFNRPADGVIDISPVAAHKRVHTITVRRLTASGPVDVPVDISGDTYTVNLAAGELDALQSAAFRIELDAIEIPVAPVAWSSAPAPVQGPYGETLSSGLFKTSGALIRAENCGGGALAFDGMAFSAGSTSFGNTFGGYHAGTQLSNSGTYGSDGSPGTVVLTGLTSGTVYRVQALVYDGRGDSWAAGRTVKFDGTDQGQFAHGVNNLTWGPGLLVTGMFTANASTQPFTIEVFKDGASKGGQLNALTLYDLNEVAPKSVSVSSPVAAGGETAMVLSWVSAAGIVYGVETNADLSNRAGWGPIATNLAGLDGLIAVTNGLVGDRMFYRIGAE